MKLHLPSDLRHAVLACITTLCGIAATSATGTLAAGVVGLALAAPAAMAASETVSSTYVYWDPTSEDTEWTDTTQFNNGSDGTGSSTEAGSNTIVFNTTPRSPLSLGSDIANAVLITNNSTLQLTMGSHNLTGDVTVDRGSTFEMKDNMTFTNNLFSKPSWDGEGTIILHSGADANINNRISLANFNGEVQVNGNFNLGSSHIGSNGTWHLKDGESGSSEAATIANNVTVDNFVLRPDTTYTFTGVVTGSSVTIGHADTISTVQFSNAASNISKVNVVNGTVEYNGTATSGNTLFTGNTHLSDGTNMVLTPGDANATTASSARQYKGAVYMNGTSYVATGNTIDVPTKITFTDGSMNITEGLHFGNEANSPKFGKLVVNSDKNHFIGGLHGYGGLFITRNNQDSDSNANGCYIALTGNSNFTGSLNISNTMNQGDADYAFGIMVLGGASTALQNTTVNFEATVAKKNALVFTTSTNVIGKSDFTGTNFQSNGAADGTLAGLAGGMGKVYAKVLTLGGSGTYTYSGDLSVAKLVVNLQGNGKQTLTSSSNGNAVDLQHGSLTFSGGGTLGNLHFINGGTNLAFEGATGTTYTVGAISAGTNDNSNHFDRNMTIKEGVTVNATSFANNWGMGVVTVNGTLKFSGELKLFSGSNSDNTKNVINGSGSVVAATFTAANQGVYKLDITNFTATTSSISRMTTITRGNVNLGTLTLGAKLLVNGGKVTIGSTAGSGTLTATAGTITLGGNSHSFGTLDLSNGGSSNAKVTVLSGGQLTATTLWGCSNSSILLEENATFTSGAVVFSGVAATADADKTKVQAGSDAEYSLNEEAYTISNATVTVNSAAATTIGNKLLGGSLINAGAGEVTTTSGWNNLKKIEARGGNINIQWFDVQGNLDTLVIGAGKTVGAHTDDSSVESVENEATLTVTKVATFGQDATLNANLNLSSSVELTLNGALQMGSSLTLHSGMTLAGEKLAELSALTFGHTVELFTGVDTLVLDSTSYTMSTDTLSEADAIDLHTYFTNVQAGSYYLGYNPQGVVYAGRSVPEPATTTLGLLALAGLCARRRRK